MPHCYKVRAYPGMVTCWTICGMDESSQRSLVCVYAVLVDGACAVCVVRRDVALRMSCGCSVSVAAGWAWYAAHLLVACCRQLQAAKFAGLCAVLASSNMQRRAIIGVCVRKPREI